SFFEGPSCVGCVAVAACTVVISPSSSPNESLITFAIGARQLVVQLALLITVCFDGSYFSWFTLKHNVGTTPGSLLVGAEMSTRFAPASMCSLALSKSVNSPVDSSTYCTPRSFHGSFDGSFSANVLVVFPLTVNEFSVALISAGFPFTVNCRCIVSYLS